MSLSGGYRWGKRISKVEKKNNVIKTRALKSRKRKKKKN